MARDWKTLGLDPPPVGECRRCGVELGPVIPEEEIRQTAHADPAPDFPGDPLSCPIHLLCLDCAIEVHHLPGGKPENTSFLAAMKAAGVDHPQPADLPQRAIILHSANYAGSPTLFYAVARRNDASGVAS